MKHLKILVYLPALLLFFSLRGLSEGSTAIGTPLDLPSKGAVANMTEAQKEALVQQMKDRVEEIRAMDRSQLTKEDRKELRHELKDMKKESRYVTGVYISVGALIIIILLLIILL